MGKAIQKRAPWLNDGDKKGSIVIGKFRYTLKRKKDDTLVYQRVNIIDQIDEIRTDYLHFITSNSSYTADYLTSISVAEFFAIVGRIRKDIDRKISALEKGKK